LHAQHPHRHPRDEITLIQQRVIALRQMRASRRRLLRVVRSLKSAVPGGGGRRGEARVVLPAAGPSAGKKTSAGSIALAAFFAAASQEDTLDLQPSVFLCCRSSPRWTSFSRRIWTSSKRCILFRTPDRSTMNAARTGILRTASSLSSR